MPALIAHYLFGLDALASKRCAAGDVAASPAGRSAFLLGCQGPDPFFFAFTPPRMATKHVLGRRMHRECVAEAFESLRANVSRPTIADPGVARAFACGMLAHYALDRTAHPFVYALEHRICSGEDGLSDAHHEVHARIESDIDGALLAVRGVGFGVGGLEPADVLELDASYAETVGRAAGALLEDCAAVVFGLVTRVGDWQAALDDMRRVYRMIEPAGSSRSLAVAGLERIVRPHSALGELAHRRDVRPDCAAMNPSARPWSDPLSGVTSSERFVDVYDRALRWYEGALGEFLGNGPCGRFVGGVDYRGRS